MTLDRAAFDQIIHSLQQDAALYFPRRSIESVKLEETIPRPYSQLARICIRFSYGEERAYIKLYRHPTLENAHNISSAKREHDAHAKLFEAFRGMDGCGVVRPIALFAELGGWVMEAIEGRTLDQELNHKGHRLSGHDTQRDLTSTLHLVGRWLHQLHINFRSDDTSSLAETGVLREIEQLVGSCPVLSPAERDAILGHGRSLARQVGSNRLPVVGRHGECYTPHHIFVSQGRIVVFDITGIKFGPPYVDLASLWIALEALRKYPLFSRQTARTLQKAFLEGYDDAISLNEATFDLFKLRNMLELLNSWSRAATRGWQGRLRWTVGLRFAKRWIADQLGSA